MAAPDVNSTKTDASVTLQEFETMAKRGRIHMAAEDTIEPSEADLNKAKSPVDLGRLYGYSEDDIASFYLRRRGGLPGIAYEEYISDLSTPTFLRRNHVLQNKRLRDSNERLHPRLCRPFDRYLAPAIDCRSI
jgi:hypothetical protein